MTVARRDVLGGAAAAMAAGPSFAQTGPGPVAETRAGRVRGYVDGGVLAFKGIPYGQDTAGRRFMAPAPARPWPGVLQCISLGPRAPQPPQGASSLANPQLATPHSEDCLKLNVWTPALDGRRRPVMIWIHGGGYSNFSANSLLNDGVRLSRKGDVVVVTLNHRINALRFSLSRRAWRRAVRPQRQCRDARPDPRP